MHPIFKKFSFKHKNNKFFYYLFNFAGLLIPRIFFRIRLQKKLLTLKLYDSEYIKGRVNYYNKLSGKQTLSPKAIALSELKNPKKNRVYYFDTHEYIRYFNPTFNACFLFGDITHIPDEPSIIKSRPIAGNNAYSVILKLNKIRHYLFIHDRKAFADKKNMLVGRSVVKQPHRIRFYEMYFGHSLCNLGQINKNNNQQWIKDKLTITEHLDYKFILCLEGYDVASNLKWVMSSNSLAVMTKPKFETWFMEGTLIPNYHFILIKDDYSDLEERLNYYITHANEAAEIIANANAYIKQFKDKKREDLISLLVLQKYFFNTDQLSVADESFFT
jgi:hypothetical protein